MCLFACQCVGRREGGGREREKREMGTKRDREREDSWCVGYAWYLEKHVLPSGTVVIGDDESPKVNAGNWI